jgi:hypothetical protein
LGRVIVSISSGNFREGFSENEPLALVPKIIT